MKKNTIILMIPGVIFLLLASCLKKSDPGTPAVESRALKDTVGFSFTAAQIERVVQTSEKLEADSLRRNSAAAWIAGICPHDDHLYAGRVYVHLFQNMAAKRYVIFGVAHKAADWGASDVLIFDSYPSWRGPFGPVRVSDLRDQLVRRLPQAGFVVNDAWQAEEHSVEGIVPFIQYYRRDAEIVSILVPYMNRERIEKLSRQLADALAQVIQERGWIIGRDVAFICSNDGDHYGDADWGGRNFAPFGADEAGYARATGQDRDLIQTTLAGELTSDKLRMFCQRVWGDTDLKDYKIRWCGRFAIPLGLNTVRSLREKLNQPALTGYALRYDTSYHLGLLPLEDIGLGTTAPANIRHWVGYSAIGYR
ncbi:MAG: AmmeMemoRadiSam system protein B [Candidatus Zhuqueibacterota bacterium]